MQDASYLRMKNLTIGYTLPQDLTRKLNIERVRFYFSGENLFEITHLKANLDRKPWIPAVKYILYNVLILLVLI